MSSICCEQFELTLRKICLSKLMFKSRFTYYPNTQQRLKMYLYITRALSKR